MSTVREHAVEGASGDLKRRVRSFLAQQGVNSAHHLTIEVRDGTVILHGLVSSFYERQLCISCCQRIAGVVRFVDNLTVALPTTR
ncbi:MAG: BON domain-containing protein [Planctomycetia bacterium]|nr:BON domain-containing protein [Planctomycetia bacterium]